jgi:hypothetical protein
MIATASGDNPSTALAIRFAMAITLGWDNWTLRFRRRTTVALEG